MDFVLLLAISILIIVFLSTVDLAIGVLSMTRLNKVAPLQDEPLPAVSVVVPACNEEAKIESSITALLRQDYQNLEIIAVDDRSTDNTGILLDKLQQRNSKKLRVFHIEDLPQGWMGKNHALKFAADRADGEYLLFYRW